MTDVLPDYPPPAPAPASAPAADPYPYYAVYWADQYPQVTPKSVLDGTAKDPQEMQMQLAAEGAPLRFTYGEDRLGALIADAMVYNNNWIFVLVWGEGPIQGVQSITMNDEPLPVTMGATHYDGSQVVPDATLVAAYAAQSPSIIYDDALTGVAYSVVAMPVSEVNGAPSFQAIVRGLKLYNPDTALTEWSECPALALRDFITSTTRGLSKTTRDASVIEVMNANNELVGGQARRKIGLTLADKQRGRDWLATLATYAGCWLLEDAGVFTLVPDRPFVEPSY